MDRALKDAVSSYDEPGGIINRAFNHIPLPRATVYGKFRSGSLNPRDMAEIELHEIDERMSELRGRVADLADCL